MVQFVDALGGLAAVLSTLIVWRWLWFRAERRRIARDRGDGDDDPRFSGSPNEDGHDQAYSGRVVRRLRARLTDGRAEVHWQFRPECVHRGFVLTAKCRRNGGGWEPLALEGCEDSGTWVECFNYGESRSYVFVVKKVYRFFFGLVANDEVEVLYDQISFSMRNGRYLKEKRELIRDRKELLQEVKDYALLESELRRMAGSSQPSWLPDGPAARLEARARRLRECEDFVERQVEEIRAHPTWTPQRKEQEIQRIREIADEQMLEED